MNIRYNRYSHRGGDEKAVYTSDESRVTTQRPALPTLHALGRRGQVTNQTICTKSGGQSRKFSMETLFIEGNTLAAGTRP